MKRKNLALELAAPPVAAASTTPEIAALPVAKAASNRVHTSIYVAKTVYRRLREIAVAEDVKVHDLVMEGIDRVIADRGHPERASRDAKALQR